MNRRKGKPVSFDAMVKFFMQQYGIPTKKDLDRLVERMDNLEKTIREALSYGRSARSQKTLRKGDKADMTASDLVLAVISGAEAPVGIPDIKEKTGFGDKKIRNIIFRLHKTGAIVRKNRGRYQSV